MQLKTKIKLAILGVVLSVLSWGDISWAANCTASSASGVNQTGVMTGAGPQTAGSNVNITDNTTTPSGTTDVVESPSPGGTQDSGTTTASATDSTTPPSTTPSQPDDTPTPTEGGGYNPLDDPNVRSGTGSGPEVQPPVDPNIGDDFQGQQPGTQPQDGGTQTAEGPPIQQPGTYTATPESEKPPEDDKEPPPYYPPYGPPPGEKPTGPDWTEWATQPRPGEKPSQKPSQKPPEQPTTTKPADKTGIDVTVVGNAPPGKTIIVQGQLVPVKGYKENIAGMTVTLTGPVNKSTTSSGGGSFSFPEIPSGDYVISVTQWNYGMTKQSFSAPSGKSIKVVLKGSCPYLYVWTGEGFEKENDIYSVARLLPQELISEDNRTIAEKDDFFLHRVSLDTIPEKLAGERSYRDYYRITRPLKTDEAGHYRVKIIEQASEHSFTDHIELLAVDHSTDSYAGITRGGKPFVYRTLKPVESWTDLDGKDYSTGQSAGLYNGEGLELSLPEEAFRGGILAITWQGFRDGQGVGHTAASGRPKLSLQRQNPQGIWQTVDRVYPRDEVSQVFFILKDEGPGWDTDGKIRLIATSCVPMKFHRIDRIAWGNSINEVLSVKSLPLISALKSVLKKD
jgi:hypothetical protein